MSVTQYDSTTASDIPTTAPAVGGYVDGLYRWSDADWARFSTPLKNRIAVFASTNDGHSLDIEAGDATPDQAPGWVRMRMAAGIARPILYVNRDNWDAVRSFVGGLPVLWWVATLDGTWNVPGADAVQYAGSNLSGGHYDLSIVFDPVTFFGGGTVPVDQHLVLSGAVHGKTLAGATWYNWGDAVNGTLVPVVGFPQPSIGQEVTYFEAVQFGGQWYDRIGPAPGQGDWCLRDNLVDTQSVSGCIDPPSCADKIKPPPPPPPPVISVHRHRITVTIGGQTVTGWTELNDPGGA